MTGLVDRAGQFACLRIVRKLRPPCQRGCDIDPPGNLDLRAQKDQLSHAHAPETDRCSGR
jgi:hypothetical protein